MNRPADKNRGFAGRRRLDEPSRIPPIAPITAILVALLGAAMLGFVLYLGILTVTYPEQHISTIITGFALLAGPAWISVDILRRVPGIFFAIPKAADDARDRVAVACFIVLAGGGLVFSFGYDTDRGSSFLVDVLLNTAIVTVFPLIVLFATIVCARKLQRSS